MITDVTDDARTHRPSLRKSRHVVSEVSTRVALAIDQFDSWFKTVELEKILPGHGSIPRVVSSQLVNGTWSNPGARRRVFMADGSSVLEEVLEQDRPSYFAYMVWQFKGPIGLLAHYGRGEFLVTAAGDHATDVRWVYSFAPRTFLAVPGLYVVVQKAFRPFMEVCIETIRRVAEEDPNNISSQLCDSSVRQGL